jgi:hypothetical protein
MNERAGVAIAVLWSTLGGLAAVATRFLVGAVDPLRRRLSVPAADRVGASSAGPGVTTGSAARCSG